MPRNLSRRLFLANALLSACLPAFSRTEPGLRNLTLILPTPPGSQPDLIARWLVEPMAQAARVPGVVVNRPGATGAIAVDAVMNSSPESGSLLLAGLDHVAYSHLNSDRKALDPVSDLLPVGTVNRDSWLVVTSKDNPMRDLRDLAGASRAAALNYATTGEGGTAHLLSARLCRALKVDAQHVPYKEGFIPDLIAGRVQFAVVPVPGVIRHVRTGSLRALAALTSARLPGLPDVPSVAELGWPDQTFHGGLFLFAPTHHAALAGQINEWLVGALRMPDIVRRYQEAEIQPTPADLRETREIVLARLQLVDSMRITVFGRAR